MALSRKKKVIIIRNIDNKRAEVDSIKEASRITGCSSNYIRLSANNPAHYSNRADDWQPTTIYGELRKQTIKPLYRFEFVMPVILVARPMFESDIKEFEFRSCYKAIKTINCNESTFYSHKKKNIKFLIDKDKRLWSIDWIANNER